MKQRLDYLDNLRTALTVLVLVFHTSIAYGGAGSWILEDVDKSELNATIILFTIFTAVCQAFFMGLFFFLTAYFIPASYDRKGAAKFLKDRLVRLGIPLAVYYFLIGPMTNWFAHYRDELTVGKFYKDYVWSFDRTFFGPAWFLEASIYFTLFYALYRLIAGRISRQPQPFKFPSGARLLVAAIALGLVAFAVRLVYPTGEGPLELQLGYFPSYIALFVAGILAYRNGWLNQIPERLAKTWKWVGIGAIPVLPVFFIATGALDGRLEFEGGVNLQALCYALWEPLVCIGIVIALLGWFQRKYNSAGRVRKWMSNNAYTVYLIHPPAIVGWTIAFHGVALPPFVKWVIVSALSVCTCFAAASAIRAVPGAKRVL
ncbi:MAG: acyltransferase [Cohnella sp.]|nr:acyltransferase [Cohnella sp.]